MGGKKKNWKETEKSTPTAKDSTSIEQESLVTDLYRQRRARNNVMSLLLASLLSTTIYGTLENPFQYTLSNIGNLFAYREYFIIWSIIAGFSIQTACVVLFKLENFRRKRSYSLMVYASIALVVTAIIPALRDLMPMWWLLHVLTAMFYAAFLILGLVPFLLFITRENPRLRGSVIGWMSAILGGCILSLVFFGKSAIYEIWFILAVTIFLMYLSLVLFEESIVKICVGLLRNSRNLDEDVEKIFIDRKSLKSRE